jgi:hypothetical protein
VAREGEAYDLTVVTLAVPRGGGGTSDTLSAPAAPDTDCTHAPPSASTTLDTHIGNDDTAPNDDPSWEGLVTNYETAHGTPTAEQIYQERWNVTGPDIEDLARAAAEATTQATYNVAIPDGVISWVPNP